MIMIFGSLNKNLRNLVKELRKQKQVVLCADDKKDDGINILIKPYEEVEMQEMFKKHVPEIVIHAYERKVDDYNNYKYNVATTWNLVQFMPKKCKLIYISTLSLLDENNHVNPHNSFEVSKLQAETVIRDNWNKHNILRLPEKISEKDFLKQVLEVL